MAANDTSINPSSHATPRATGSGRKLRLAVVPFFLALALPATLAFAASYGSGAPKEPLAMAPHVAATEPSLSPTVPVVATPTAAPPPVAPAAPSLGDTVAVRWLPADVLNLLGAVEPADPLAAERKERAQGAPQGAATGSNWGVYVVGADGNPRLLHSSLRLIDSLKWDKVGLVAGFQTKRQVESAALGRQVTLAWEGSLKVDPASGGVSERFDALPLDPGRFGFVESFGRDPNATSPVMLVEQDSSRTQLLVTVGAATPGSPGSRRSIDAIYVVDAKGNGRKLEGVPSFSSVSWLPGNKVLVGRRFGAGAPGDDVYFIPLQDGEAVLAPRVRNLAPEYADPQIQTSGTGRAALIMAGPQSGTTRTDYLGIYEASTGKARMLGSGHWGATTSGGYVIVQWAGPGLLRIGQNAGAELIDVITGDRRPAPAETPPNGGLDGVCRAEASSAGGRFVAKIEVTGGQAGQECVTGSAKLRLTNRQAAATTTVFDLPEGTCGRLEWLNETKLLLTVTHCGGMCGPGSYQYVLIDAVLGQADSLTEGMETAAIVLRNPAKNELLVGTSRIRVYDYDARILRDLSLPAGYKVWQYAWSPDGLSLAFVLGPELWYWGI